MTDYLPLPGTPVEELDTPCIIVDLDVAEANIAKLQTAANEMSVDVRPHSKTHNSHAWARPPMDAGANSSGVPAAREAEGMVGAAWVQSP